MRLQARNFFADRVNNLDRVGVGLAEHRQHDGAVLVVPCLELVIDDAVDHIGDFAEPDGRAVAEGHDHRPIALGVLDLAGRGQGHVARVAAQAADGGGRVRRNDGRPDVVQRQAARGRKVRVGLDANGVFLLTEDQHLRNARNLRNLLGENLLGVFVGHRQRQQRRGERQRNDGRVGRVHLAEARGSGQFRWQAAQGGGDLRLHVEGGAVDVAVKVELHDDVGVAVRRARRHQRHARDRCERALERSSDRSRHRLGIRARQLGGHRDRRVIDARQGRDGKL